MELTDLISSGERAIAYAVANREVESLTLDFKEPGQREGALFENGKLTKQGQRVIGQALSAFANSAGGILVIGVRCKPIDGVDAASELMPITDFKRCQSSLSGILGAMLQPRHEGLQLHSATALSQEDAGYLIVEVPRSERRPHMAQVDHHYYKRSGASTFVMEHYDIEDAFRRASSPQLILETEARKRMQAGTPGGRWNAQIFITLAVRNAGDVSANAPSLTFDRFGGGQFILDTSYEQFNYQGRRTISTNADFVVHVGETRVLGEMVFNGEGEQHELERIGFEPRWSNFVGAEYSLVAQDMRPQRGELKVMISDLHRVWLRG